MSTKAKVGQAIPYGRQSISAADIQAVVDVLSSDWLTQGPAIERFEHAVAEYCGAKYALAVSSASAALHIACMAVGLGPEQSLWTSPNTFVASANCGRYCGSEIDFVDIDSRTYNMSATALEGKLREASEFDGLPKVVVPVHFAGQSCEMKAIKKLSDKYGYKIIEDAAHAIGGRYADHHIGSCHYSDITVFSFHPVKIITTGEGGMITTNDKALHEKALRLRSHGITRNPELMVSPPAGAWDYQQLELGYNYRMTDIQAALGSSQLSRIDQFVERRHALASRYDQALRDLPLELPYQHPDNYSSYHLYVIKVKEAAPLTRAQLFQQLRDAGIGVNVHYIPVHLQPYYRQLGFSAGDFPNAETYYEHALTLPLHFGLSEADQDFVIDTLRKLLA